jgi:hypothetical protein
MKIIIELSEKQEKKFEKWKKKLPKEPRTAIGGRYTWMITPTGVGEIIRVRAEDVGKELDLTEYEKW